MRTCEERRYSSTNSLIQRWMDTNGQFYTEIQRKYAGTSFLEEDVWTLWRREKSVVPADN
jgi:hypothetical protein